MPKYFPATLNANEGSIIKTVANKSLINVSSSFVSGVSGPDVVKTRQRPIIPKAIDEYIKTRVAIFCMVAFYHTISRVFDDIGNCEILDLV